MYTADFSTDDGVMQRLMSYETNVQCFVRSYITSSGSQILADVRTDHLALMMRVHIGAPMVLTETLAPALLGSDNPSVIHVSDHVANRGSDQHMAYAASKSAMLNLTKSQAKKYAPEIRVNALCPALLDFRDEDEAAYRERAIAKSALKIVPGFDVAIEAICYLQSNRYTTGSIFHSTVAAHSECPNESNSDHGVVDMRRALDEYVRTSDKTVDLTPRSRC